MCIFIAITIPWLRTRNSGALNFIILILLLVWIATLAAYVLAWLYTAAVRVCYARTLMKDDVRMEIELSKTSFPPSYDTTDRVDDPSCYNECCFWSRRSYALLLILVNLVIGAMACAFAIVIFSYYKGRKPNPAGGPSINPGFGSGNSLVAGFFVAAAVLLIISETAFYYFYKEDLDNEKGGEELARTQLDELRDDRSEKV